MNDPHRLLDPRWSLLRFQRRAVEEQLWAKTPTFHNGYDLSREKSLWRHPKEMDWEVNLVMQETGSTQSGPFSEIVRLAT